MTIIRSLREDRHLRGQQRKRLDNRDQKVVKVSPKRESGEGDELGHTHQFV